MDRTFADMLYRATEEIVRIECRRAETMIAAYADDNGVFPHVIHNPDTGRCWCEAATSQKPSAADDEYAKRLAAEYREQTNIPAGMVVSVRTFEGTRFAWHWEERK